MRRIFKVTGISLAILIFLFFIFAWIVFEKKNDWLLNSIQSYMNKSQSGQLEIENINLKLLRNFPDVTIELDGIKYYEHWDSLRTPGEKPIVQADQLFIAIKLLPLLKKEMIVEMISLPKTLINLIEYPNGKINLELALSKHPEKKPIVFKKTSPLPPANKSKPKAQIKKALEPSNVSVKIDLKQILFKDIVINWNSSSNQNTSSVFVNEIKSDISSDGKISSGNISIKSNDQKIYLSHLTIPKGDLIFNTAFRFDKIKQFFSFDKSEIKYNTLSIFFSGDYSLKEKRLNDLHLNVTSENLQFLSPFINADIIKQNPEVLNGGKINITGRIFSESAKQPLQMEMNVNATTNNMAFLSFIARPGVILPNAESLKQGSVYVNGKIFGELTSGFPQADISFGMKNLSFSLPQFNSAFKDVGFEGRFINENPADLSKASIEIKNLNGKLPGGFIKGQFMMKNFVQPYVSYNLDAQLKLDGYDQIFKIDEVKNLSGTVNAQANFNGPLKLISNHSMDNRRSSSFTLNNLSFILTKSNKQISNLSAIIETKNNRTSIKHFSAKYDKDDIDIDATSENLLYYLFFKESDLQVLGKIYSSQLYTKDFIIDTTGSAQVDDRISNLNLDFRLSLSPIYNTDSSSRKNIYFVVNNLKAGFDKLPDIKNLNTKGWFRHTVNGLELDLEEFHAVLPNGIIDVNGNMIIPESRLLQINAKVNMNKFPWTYIDELFAEISPTGAPKAKNLPVSKMELVTCNLDLATELISFPFDINKLIVRNSKAQLTFPDGKSISTDKLNMSFDAFHFSHPKNSGSITGIKSAKGTIDMTKFIMPGFNPIDLAMNVAGENDLLNISFTRKLEVSKSEKGSFTLNISKKEPDYRLYYTIDQGNLAHYIRKYYKHKFMEGEINTVLDLHSQGLSWDSIKYNMNGIIEISGDSLDLYGINIDELLKKFKKSQNFNLTDLGAVLVAGPVGLAVTKGSDFVSLARINFDSTSYSNIHKLYSRWKLNHLQLTTDDVALTTSMNRIAFNGQLDFGNDSIPGLTVAVVDKNGCSLMDQKLYGKMKSLKTGKLNVAKTVFGSVINSVNAVVGKDCTPVYTGKVKNPLQ